MGAVGGVRFFFLHANLWRTRIGSGCVYVYVCVCLRVEAYREHQVEVSWRVIACRGNAVWVSLLECKIAIERLGRQEQGDFKQTWHELLLRGGWWLKVEARIIKCC